MADVKLTYDSLLGEYDVSIENGDLARDEGLETAVAISLYTDRRPTDSEVAPEFTNDRRGWWGNETFENGDQVGSMLWTLARMKLTDEAIKKAKEYAEQALAWLVEDLVAELVAVDVTRESMYSLVFSITIQKPENVIHRYKMAWSAMQAAA